VTPGQQQRKDAQDKARRQQQADEKVRELEKEIERLREALSVASELAWPFDADTLTKAAANGDWDTVDQVLAEWRAYKEANETRRALDGGGDDHATG
jgi:archaellum component FlaC